MMNNCVDVAMIVSNISILTDLVEVLVKANIELKYQVEELTSRVTKIDGICP